MYIELPGDVLFIIDRIREYGYRADIVGGAVRDSILKRALGDFDITTNALPEKIKEIFSDFRTIDTGIKHGTVTLVLNRTQYEITTYRIDGGYTDNRHPDSVSFTADIKEDLARRDFTVNAIAYNPYDGLTDPYDGNGDISRGIIRAVGEPCTRFDEDALRILRALRFSSVLGFDIEKDTSAAIFSKYLLLGGVSRERVYTELKKLIMGDRAIEVLRAYADVFAHALNGVRLSEFPNERLYRDADYFTRLASLFYLNCEDCESVADATLVALKTDKFVRQRITSVLKAYKKADYASEKDVIHALMEYGYDTVKGVFDLSLLLGAITDAEYGTLSKVMADDPVYTISRLSIGGDDLIGLGYRGEEIGVILKSLLIKVIDGEVENSREALIASLDA